MFTRALLVNGAAAPVERQAREVPAGGKRTAGESFAAQPHRVIELLAALLLLL